MNYQSIRKKIGIALLIIICLQLDLPTQVCSQENESQQVRVSKFQIFMHTGQMIEGKNGVLTRDIFTGMNSNGQNIEIKLSDIRAIYTKKGSKAVAGAAYGAGTMAVGGLIGLMGAETNSLEGDSNLLPVFACLVGAGVLVGALIGSAFESWQRIPVDITTRNRANDKKAVLSMRFNF